MHSVQILMSTYNGGNRIVRQIDSIMNQQDVEISLLIRDDQSTDDTLDIISKLQLKYPNKIRLMSGKNCGWKLSFRKLLFVADEYDYYGFSDQDDYWLPHKISSCIKKMESEKEICPKLVHCNSMSVDDKFMERSEKENRIPCPLSNKMAIATEVFQGCGMVWNKEAMNLIKQYNPKSLTLAHDYWVGLICYFFGKVFFIEEPLFYHIRYSDSASADGNRSKGRLKRLQNIMNKNRDAYMNPSLDLLQGYSSLLKDEDKAFLRDLNSYKTNFKAKVKLLTDTEFRRPSKESTFLMKLSIMFNKF